MQFMVDPGSDCTIGGMVGKLKTSVEFLNFVFH